MDPSGIEIICIHTLKTADSVALSLFVRIDKMQKTLTRPSANLSGILRFARTNHS